VKKLKKYKDFDIEETDELTIKHRYYSSIKDKFIVVQIRIDTTPFICKIIQVYSIVNDSDRTQDQYRLNVYKYEYDEKRCEYNILDNVHIILDDLYIFKLYDSLSDAEDTLSAIKISKKYNL